MQAAWVARFSQRNAMLWILGAVLVSAGAGVTTTAVLDGSTTVLASTAVVVEAPTLTGPDATPLPADWRPFIQVTDNGTGFNASVRAPYSSSLLLNVPLKNAANNPQTLRLHLDAAAGLGVDAATAPATLAQYGNLVGDAGSGDFLVAIPAGAAVTVQLKVKVPALLGAFDLKASLEPLN